MLRFVGKKTTPFVLFRVSPELFLAVPHAYVYVCTGRRFVKMIVETEDVEHRYSVDILMWKKMKLMNGLTSMKTYRACTEDIVDSFLSSFKA